MASNSRTKMAKDLLETKTLSYRPSPISRPTMVSTGLPPFGLYYIERMRLDPQVRLAMSIKMAPLLKMFIEVDGDPTISQFVQESFQKAWTTYIYKAWSALWYTQYFAEPIYKFDRNAGVLKVRNFKSIYPSDARILLKGSALTGIKVKCDPKYSDNEEHGTAVLRGSKKFVFVNQREFGSWQGRSEFEPAFRPYYEKTMRDGANDIRLMWFYANAYDRGDIYYPNRDINDEFGNPIRGGDYARKMQEQAKTGASWMFPSDTTGDGKMREWERTRPQGNPGPAVEMQGYIDALDREITRAIGIPDDILVSPGVGSYAGRNVPAQAFFISSEIYLREMISELDEQIYRPLCWLNFGSDDYEITNCGIDIGGMGPQQQQGMPMQGQQQPQGGMIGQNPMQMPPQGQIDPQMGQFGPMQMPQGGGIIDPNTGMPIQMNGMQLPIAMSRNGQKRIRTNGHNSSKAARIRFPSRA